MHYIEDSACIADSHSAHLDFVVGHTEEVEHFRVVACFVQEEVVESVDSHSED